MANYPHFSNRILFKNSAPSDNPPAGYIYVFADGDELKQKDSSGTVTSFVGAGGGLANLTETLHTSAPNNTVNVAQLEVTGGTTNTDLVLTPKGTGAFIVGRTPNGTATGGNKPSANAVQIITVRNDATQVASGVNTVGIGQYVKPSGNSSVAIGNGAMGTSSETVAIGTGAATGEHSISVGGAHWVSGQGSAILGGRTVINAAGFFAALSSYGVVNAAHGGYGSFPDSDSGGMTIVRRWTTTDATPVKVNRFYNIYEMGLVNNAAWGFTVDVVARQSSGSAHAYWTRRGLIQRTGGTTSIVGTVQTVGSDLGSNSGSPPSGWGISVEADDTNESLACIVTGATSTTIKWTVVVRIAMIIH